MKTVGQKRLLTLAAYLEKLDPSELRMASWVGYRGQRKNTYDLFRDHLSLKRPKGSTVANIRELTSECGYTACAIGHAGGIRSFREQGFHLVYGDNGVVSPRYQNVRDWNAVMDFFHLTKDEADYLFHPSEYSDRVRPSTVAKRIRTFVALTPAVVAKPETTITVAANPWPFPVKHTYRK